MSVLCKIDLVEETHTGKNCANRLMFYLLFVILGLFCALKSRIVNIFVH